MFQDLRPGRLGELEAEAALCAQLRVRAEAASVALNSCSAVGDGNEASIMALEPSFFSANVVKFPWKPVENKIINGDYLGFPSMSNMLSTVRRKIQLILMDFAETPAKEEEKRDRTAHRQIQ